MNTFANRVLDNAFAHPRGPIGRLGGALMAKGNAETERHLVRIARVRDSDTALVLGFGPGIGLHAVAQTAAHTIGIDPSAAMLEVAQSRCASSATAGTVELRLGTAERTDLAAASVDLALSVNNVQIWPDLDAGVTELYRVLRPGGRLLISVHERWAPRQLLGAVSAAGFAELQSWRWEPNSRMAGTALQLRASKPGG